MQTDLLTAAETYVSRFFRERISPKFAYHDFQHTQYVVSAANQIAEGYDLSNEDRETIQLACWFHDLGYDEGQEGHEVRSCQYARTYLEGQGCSPESIVKIEHCIMATKLPQSPQNLMEQIVCDADLSHLGHQTYWDRCGRVRQELAQTRGLIMSDQEWVDFELEFMSAHQYHTEMAHELFNDRKQKHIEQLFKQKLRLQPETVSIDNNGEGTRLKKKKKKSKGDWKSREMELKQINLGRGVETMYRTTYRTHISLSSIADNKANIMLSINAIVISIIISNLVPHFGDMPRLVAPTMVLLSVCLGALVFAILSTRPKVTQGRFSREDIEGKRANLLFFGNFYNMNIDDFHWGMMELIKDSDFLYSSMTRDLYYLGIVLAKKYRYLRICYGIFMYGMILAVAAFALAFAI